MSARPKAVQFGRRAKNGSSDNETKSGSGTKEQTQENGNKGHNTTTIIPAPPAQVILTTPTPPVDRLEPATSLSETSSKLPVKWSAPGSEGSTASPSEVSVRYSLTPGERAATSQLTGVQVSIEPDPLGVAEERMDLTQSPGAHGGTDDRALVLLNQHESMDGNLLKPAILHEGYSSSDDSTNSARSAGDERRQLSIVRTGSKTDSSESSSIAVDCHTGPSEVIVKGKNVRKIRVKFPPHPPGTGEEMPSMTSMDRQSKSGRFRRPSNLQRSLGSQPQEHGEDLPISTQETGYDHMTSYDETSRPRIQHALPLNTAPVLPGIPGVRAGALEQQSPGLRDSGISALSLDMHFSGSYECDQKIKHDIINGIEYFEKKNFEMKQINNKILVELERVTRLSHQLDDRLQLATERNKEISMDNDELKIKIDQREKEHDKSKEHAMTQWQARVKSDELYMELKRDTDVEIKRLNDLLSNKEKEIARIITSASQKEKSIRNAVKEPGIANRTLRANMEDHLELLHKITRLEEEISKVKGDQEKEKLSNKKGKEEADLLKGKLKDHHTELDSQYKRFLSLKKNFNDLRDENEKLKLQLRGRRNMNPNNTWPKNTTGETIKPGENEAVSYFDIPTKFGKSISPASKKLVKPMLEHKRTASEGRSTISENLPPVAATLK